MKKVIAYVLIILGIILGAFELVTKAIEKKSIGIIGGADGPTAIFVAGSTGNAWIVILLIGLVLVFSGIFMLIKKK